MILHCAKHNVLTIISLRAGAQGMPDPLDTQLMRIETHPNVATVLNVSSYPARASWPVLRNSLCEEALASVLSYCNNDSVLELQGAAEGRGTLYPT